MGKHRSAVNCKIPPWLSARQPPSESRYIQVGDSLLFNKTFQSLKDSSKYLYQCLAMESGGRKQVTLSRRGAGKYGITPATYSRSKNELIEKGFIQISQDIGRYDANRFEFINDWKNKKDVSD